jgi:hypothetical protein
MMSKYDPDRAPDSAEWLDLDEQERIALVEDYHRRARVKLPSLTAHALFHVTVENQIAEGLEAVLRAMARLTKAGLSRHDAVHAIANVVAEHMFELLNSKDDAAVSQARYISAVERVTAKSWREG